MSEAAGYGELSRALLRLAIPAASTGLLETLVFLADRVMLGRYSQEALASMHVQGPVIWSLFSVFMGVCVGSVSVVARSVGARDLATSRAASRSTVALAAGSGAVVALGAWVATPWLVAWVGPESPEIGALSVTYLRIALFGFPGLFVATAAAMVLGAAGDTRTPFAVAGVTNLVNVALNQLLIFGAAPIGLPALGVAGAAIAGVIAFTLQAALLLRVLRRSGSPVCIRGETYQAPITREILRVSSPVLVERVVFHLGYLGYAAVISRMGALVMAGHQALLTLEAVCFLTAQGFGVATAALVGQSLGRRDVAGARRAGLLGAGLSAAVLTALGLVIWWSGPLTLRAFVAREQGPEAAEQLIQAGLVALPLLALSQPFMAVGAVLCDALRGAGATRPPLVVTLVGSLAIRIPLVIGLGLIAGGGTAAVWTASALDWAVRAALALAIFVGPGWTRVSVRTSPCADEAGAVEGAASS
ncbi:MAG: MATE family efflux transporter [Polyangiaceae bacterium]|nr:MATE family efflux transporter [Polyangiaceae bacterium]